MSLNSLKNSTGTKVFQLPSTLMLTHIKLFKIMQSIKKTEQTRYYQIITNHLSLLIYCIIRQIEKNIIRKENQQINNRLKTAIYR